MQLPHRALPILVCLLLVSMAPTAAAGTQTEPEMPDRTGDVDPLSLVGLKPDELDFIEGNLSMFDIRNAWVTGENPSQFFFVIDVVDLFPELPEPDPTGVVPNMVAGYEVHFTNDAGAWFVRASLEPLHYVDPTTAPPTAMLFWVANLTLHQDDAEETFISRIGGALVPQYDWVYFTVPKELIGSPAAGDEMRGLYATSTFMGQVLDFAPDATLDPESIDPEGLEPADPFGTAVTPGYGTPYEYGQFPGSGASPRIELTPTGATSLEVAPGARGDLAVQVKNLGNQEQKVTFTTTDPAGWSIELDPVEATLQPGSTQALLITATPGENARSPGILRLNAATASETQTLVFTLQTPNDQGTVGGNGTPSSGDGDGDPPETKDSPAPVLLVPLALAALAMAWNRRHAS